MKNISHIKKKISDSHRIAIACHRNPDGDCIGSLLALGLGLQSLKKHVVMISHDGVPGNYQKLPGSDKIRKTIKKVPDMAITVDCSAKEMVGPPLDVMKKSKYILEIDHHEFREPFGNLFLIDNEASAVGEMIYYLFRTMQVDITKDIAQNILTSIIVDTNSFRLPVVRASTFRICADLLETGVDFSKLSEIVYWSKTKAGAVLSGRCMSNLKVIQNGKIAWTLVTRADLIKTGGKDEDVDAVANDILSINTVRIAIFFREQNAELLRVSLRSKGRVNVASLAHKYGGGGHPDSAGCYITNTRKEMAGFVEAAKELLE